MDVKMLELLSEKGYEPPMKRPEKFGVTVSEFMAEKNCSRDIARNLLNNAKDAGIIEMHLMDTGKNTREAVYHKPGDWPPE